ncbi:hypothetical protein NM69176_2170 [Neisseria meningitidis 69176]|nr:hypothetical protein NM69176_2170 [Neisseria meningitidis 69176]
MLAAVKPTALPFDDMGLATKTVHESILLPSISPLNCFAPNKVAGYVVTWLVSNIFQFPSVV